MGVVQVMVLWMVRGVMLVMVLRDAALDLERCIRIPG